MAGPNINKLIEDMLTSEAADSSAAVSGSKSAADIGPDKPKKRKAEMKKTGKFKKIKIASPASPVPKKKK